MKSIFSHFEIYMICVFLGNHCSLVYRCPRILLFLQVFVNFHQWIDFRLFSFFVSSSLNCCVPRWCVEYLSLSLDLLIFVFWAITLMLLSNFLEVAFSYDMVLINKIYLLRGLVVQNWASILNLKERRYPKILFIVKGYQQNELFLKIGMRCWHRFSAKTQWKGRYFFRTSVKNIYWAIAWKGFFWIQLF